jgi:group I intron endonuclease
MKKIIINDTILLFLGINDFEKITKNDLINLKKKYLIKYDNCIIYNYYDLCNKKKIIRDKINKIKFNNQIKIGARNCNIQLVDNKIKNDFLNEYHIQGTDKSQIYFAAYYNNEIISIMSFNTSNKFIGGLNENEYELSRFAIKSGYIINGLFEKMLKKFINVYSPKKILSFADLNMSNGVSNIYVNNGFILNKIIRPDYRYYSKIDNRIYHKFTFGTKYDKNESISNHIKIDRKNQLIKVWNCGKLKYELFIDNNNQIVFGFIYMITNKINNKIYIGQTTRNIQKRIYEYKSAFNLKNHNNPHLYNAFNKYGWDNFEFKIIDTAQTIEELNDKEINYIQKYNTTNKEFGYNIESGGKNAIPNIETLEKMSKSHLGLKQTENWVSKRIAIAGSDGAKKYGKVKSEEEKNNISIKSPKYWLGKNRDVKTKLKISETKMMNGLSDRQKEVICKKVYKTDLINNVTTTFESATDAAKFEMVNQSTISRWCQKNKIINNISWGYLL